ncbi:NAD(P)/FAD-dependent oxidoreductase [Amycolatopsis nigrescens]|uniref:NAD(P)/FAD-dependent oxidoreductase n=1 Tax=Amycolatopsis nigrescens TaxID=381445 RepID=UPI00036718B0|nr:FAD-dependent oxidoreductase [Amycolatopsis nigrescens]
MKTIAIVGTSLAGLSSARALRAQGFDGRLVLIGEEPHRPYDRPPLSKDFLLGRMTAEELELGDAADLLELNAQWYLGKRAVRLDMAAGAVTLSDGTEIDCDGVLVATGASPRTLAGTGFPAEFGVHTLRTLDDAKALRAELACGARVVVIGAGFIGAEVASACRTLGCEVTVVEAAPVPLAGVLGERMGRLCADLHGEHGVRLITGTGVAGLSGGSAAGTASVLTGVRLTDGRELPADVVVAGIGARPNTGWLAGSGLAVDDGVLCDSGCLTANPRVAAAGDVARYRCPHTGRLARAEHWTAAAEQPAVAVRNLLAGGTVEQYARPGYFWSDLYGQRIQFAGSAEGHDELQVVDGALTERKFVVTYHRGGNVVGVLAMNSPRPFTRLRRSLNRPPMMVHPG